MHWFIPPLLKNTLRVHELVARSSAWRVRTTNSKVKSNSLTLSTASAIPRVRTYHTKKPSRFVHALSARPLDNGWRGRESNAYADGTIKINPISLCSHPDTHPNSLPCLGDADRVRLRESVNSREVRHSLTWHSSESESALERFEPVAVVML